MHLVACALIRTPFLTQRRRAAALLSNRFIPPPHPRYALFVQGMGPTRKLLHSGRYVSFFFGSPQELFWPMQRTPRAMDLLSKPYAVLHLLPHGAGWAAFVGSPRHTAFPRQSFLLHPSGIGRKLLPLALPSRERTTKERVSVPAIPERPKAAVCSGVVSETRSLFISADQGAEFSTERCGIGGKPASFRRITRRRRRRPAYRSFPAGPGGSR